jgi:hypothetical protein
MKIFFAGNFEYLGKIEKETELANLCLGCSGEYNRLSSFFFLKETNNVITVMNQLKGKSDGTSE